MRHKKKAANDAAYALAAQLLAAKVNIAAGAAHSADVDRAIEDADIMLGCTDGLTLHDGFVVTEAACFDGNGTYWKGGKNASEMRTEALKLAGLLDNYNNNMGVTYP